MFNLMIQWLGEGRIFMRLYERGIHFYISGLVILTLGIALCVISLLGTSPFDALFVGLYRTFGLSIGSWEIVIGLIMVFGNALVDRGRPEYFAIITSLITGIGIDSWLFVFDQVSMLEGLLAQWIYLTLGIIFTGLGIAIYLQSDIAPNPIDRTMMIIKKHTGWNVTYSRALINVLFVVVAFFFDGAIGIGTLLNAVIVGMFIAAFLPFVTKLRKEELT